ncbi:hypothetical protein DPMN_044283 [Dreissena polymorpha]|uniref:Uncharacterized protein n=1 Tax=Dreissena polymorpha TaxID=45954 RepID=A0A9D4D462_DREPO|nr:hypothetical protein DPMN_044283 [Dreissena polymorpha]
MNGPQEAGRWQTLNTPGLHLFPADRYTCLYPGPLHFNPVNPAHQSQSFQSSLKTVQLSPHQAHCLRSSQNYFGPAAVVL